MSTMVNVQEAKTRLSEVLRRVEAGEEIVIARAGRPIARIQAVEPRRRRLDVPLLPEIPPIPVDTLFEEMTDQELSDWEDLPSSDPLSGTARS